MAAPPTSTPSPSSTPAPNLDDWLVRKTTLLAEQLLGNIATFAPQRAAYAKDAAAQLLADQALLAVSPDATISSCALHFPRSESNADRRLGGLHRDVAQLLFSTAAEEAAAAAELAGAHREKKRKALGIWSHIRLSKLVSVLSVRVRRQQEQARVEALSRKHATAIHAVDPSGLRWCLLKNRPVSSEVRNPLPMPIAPLPQHRASFARCLEFLRKHRDGIPWTAVGAEVDGYPVQLDATTGVRFLDLEHFAVYDDRRFDGCKRGYTPGVVERLFEALEGNTYFEHFLFGNNASGSKGCAGLVHKLLPPGHRFRTLYLAGMNVTQEADWKLLADTLRDDTHVEALWLKRNKVGVAGAKALAECLRANRTLRVLDLDETALGDDGFAAICDALAENGTVRHLYARGNGLGPASGAALAKCLRGRSERNLPGLRSVFLGSNRLGDEGVAAIAGALPFATDLRRLVLASNRIEAAGMRALAAAPLVPSLEVVDLGIEVTTADLGELPNRITDEGVDAVLEFLRNQQNLRSLAIAHNRFSRESLGKIYTAVGKEHPRLLHLDIGERGFKRDAAAWTQVVQELTRKIAAHHRWPLSYQQFICGGKLAALRNIRATRNIDSIYRTADFRGANRKKLVKRWPHDRVELEEEEQQQVAQRETDSTMLDPRCSGDFSSLYPPTLVSRSDAGIVGVAAAQRICDEIAKETTQRACSNLAAATSGDVAPETLAHFEELIASFQAPRAPQQQQQQ